MKKKIKKNGRKIVQMREGTDEVKGKNCKKRGKHTGRGR